MAEELMADTAQADRSRGAGIHGALGVPRRAALDFRRTPFTTIWEVTRACDLRCVHCRASAQCRRDPSELTTQEGWRLLDQVHDLGSPVFVITGGDPLQRDDLYELVEYGVRRGLSMAVTPSGTPRLTRAAVHRLHGLGVRRMALSLDGPTAAIHDAFRQQPGSYGWTIAGVEYASECGLPVQINTTVTRRNLEALPAVARVVGQIGARTWSVFFLVNVGRAQAQDQLRAEEYEDVFAFLAELSLQAPFSVRTTAAPHYRRFLLQRETAAKRLGKARAQTEPAPPNPAADLPRAHHGVTDGNGFVFISHTGDVYPSGFLPLRAGNVREEPLAHIYRESPLFRRLHDVTQLEGKCGVCEYRHVCGGSRARAYAATGNPLAEEPFCAYQPAKRSPVEEASGQPPGASP
jgi:AdoMet-dependent heme synthase